MAEARGMAPEMLRAVDSRNQSQKQRLFEKIRDRFGAQLAGRTIGVWGFAFKPARTICGKRRRSPSSRIGAGASVKAYDLVAMENARRVLPASWFESGKLTLVEQQYDAAEGADALVLVTEWKPFHLPDFEALKRLMRSPVIFDGRNQYEPRHVRSL